MMKKYLYILLLGVVSPSFAKPAVTTKVAYVNAQEVQQKDPWIKDQKGKIEKFIEASEFEKKAQKMQKIRGELSNPNKVKVMSEDAQRKKQEEFYTVSSEVAKIQEEATQMEQEILQEFQERVNEAVETVRKKGDWDAVEPIKIGKVSERIDVTKEVIDELNKSYKASKKSDNKED